MRCDTKLLSTNRQTNSEFFQMLLEINFVSTRHRCTRCENGLSIRRRIL